MRILDHIDFNNTSRALNVPAPRLGADLARFNDALVPLRALVEKIHKPGRFSLAEPVRIRVNQPINLSTGFTVDATGKFPADNALGVDRCQAGDRILITAQSDPNQNGIYTYPEIGGILVRETAENAALEGGNTHKVYLITDGAWKGHIWYYHTKAKGWVDWSGIDDQGYVPLYTEQNIAVRSLDDNDKENEASTHINLRPPISVQVFEILPDGVFEAVNCTVRIKLGMTTTGFPNNRVQLAFAEPVDAHMYMVVTTGYLIEEV